MNKRQRKKAFKKYGPDFGLRCTITAGTTTASAAHVNAAWDRLQRWMVAVHDSVQTEIEFHERRKAENDAYMRGGVASKASGTHAAAGNPKIEDDFGCLAHSVKDCAICKDSDAT